MKTSGGNFMVETSPVQRGSRRHRATWLTAGIAVASAALIAVGTVLGAAGNSHHGQIAAQQAQISARQKQIRSLRQSLVTVDAQASSAREDGKGAGPVRIRGGCGPEAPA